MFDIVIRKQDTLPIIQKTFYVAGSPVNLTDYAIVFIVTDLDGMELVNNGAVIDDAENGVVNYKWTPADSDAVTGNYAFAYFQATSAGGEILTAPNNRPMSFLLTDTSHHEYSYSGDPSARPIDKFRFIIGDTNMDKALFTDSEIAFLLTEYGSVYAAGAEAADIQAGRYAQVADKAVGPLRISYSDLANRWSALSRSLRTRSGKNSGAKVVLTQNSKEPHITLGIHDRKVPSLYEELRRNQS